MTTPSDGAVEMDATNMYGTTDVGNRGYIPLVHFIRADATRTYTSNTSAQAIFNSPANGRITLETGAYQFRGLLNWNTMSATSGNRNVNMLGAGTATVAAWMWSAWGYDGANGTATTFSGMTTATSTSPASIVTATIGTELTVNLAGIVRSDRSRNDDPLHNNGHRRRLGTRYRVVHRNLAGRHHFGRICRPVGLGHARHRADLRPRNIVPPRLQLGNRI